VAQAGSEERSKLPGHKTPGQGGIDAIAARQLHALRQHYAGKLKLIDVKEMFLQMRDQA
jgi:hypothetical protein